MATILIEGPLLSFDSSKSISLFRNTHLVTPVNYDLLTTIIKTCINISFQGDNGGPLICNDVVVGVLSIVLSCGHRLPANVYTRIGSYVDWIKDTTGIEYVPRS